MPVLQRWSRRDFLKGLTLLVALPPVACAAQQGLSESDHRIASLGRKLAEAEPELAAALVQRVAAETPGLDAGAAPAARARVVRRQWLGPTRLAAEFDAGDVVRIDGWLLARSEAAAAAYLDMLVREIAIAA